MSGEDLGDVTDQDRDLMEGLGLLFDLGIYGVEHPATVGGPRPSSGLTVERTASVQSVGLSASGTLPSVSTELSFGDDPLRELTEKCVHHVSGE